MAVKDQAARSRQHANRHHNGYLAGHTPISKFLLCLSFPSFLSLFSTFWLAIKSRFYDRIMPSSWAASSALWLCSMLCRKLPWVFGTALKFRYTKLLAPTSLSGCWEATCSLSGWALGWSRCITSTSTRHEENGYVPRLPRWLHTMRSRHCSGSTGWSHELLLLLLPFCLLASNSRDKFKVQSTEKCRLASEHWGNAPHMTTFTGKTVVWAFTTHYSKWSYLQNHNLSFILSRCSSLSITSK